MANRPVCKFYAKGNCKYGNSCKFAHVKDSGGSIASNELSKFTSASNLGNKTAELKEGLKDYGSFQCKPVLSSFGLGYPAVNNLISGRDFSFEEQRLLYLQALASNNVEDYNRSMEARAKDMDSCVDYLIGKEQHAARYQQKSAEPNAGIPKPFIPMSLEENLTRIMNDPNGITSNRIPEPGPSWASSSTGPSGFGGTGLQGSNPFSSTMNSSPFASSQSNQAGSLGSLNTNASLNNKPSDQAGFGQSGFGQSGFGQSGFGQSGFGQSGFGNSGFGQSGFGQSGVGNSGFGQSGFGQSGFGQSGFGQSGFGQSGFGQSGFGNSGSSQSGLGQSNLGKSGFGHSGFGNSGFGKSGFAQADSGKASSSQTNSPSTGLGSSGFGSLGFGQSGFGQSGLGNSGFGQSSFGNSGFGKSGFGNSGFSQPSSGQSGFGQSGFGQSGFGQSGFGQSGFGKSGFDLSKPAPTSSGLGSSGFASSQTGPVTSGFGQSGLGSLSKESSGFGQFANKPEPNKPELDSSTSSGFGQSGFGKFSSEKPTFGSSSFGSSTSSPFSSTNTGSPMVNQGHSSFPSNEKHSNSQQPVFGGSSLETSNKPSAFTGFSSQSSFGNDPSKLSGATNSTRNQLQDSSQVDLKDYDERISKAFAAAEFQLGEVPEVPPPITIC